jgi:hypothetical protein
MIDSYQGLQSVRERIPLSVKPQIIEMFVRLVKLYEKWNHDESANQWRQNLEQAKSGESITLP